MRTASVTLETATGAHSFEVEVAETREQQMLGLMFRTHLPTASGMLFVYPKARRIRMWMKNTKVPLDMIFIDGGGTVVYVVADTVPFSETVIAPPVLARAVLEVNAGTARRLGLRIGDRVRPAPDAAP